MTVEYAALLILAVAVAGCIVLFGYLRRLKRAALAALEAARRVEASMESFRATTAAQEQAAPRDDGPQR